MGHDIGHLVVIATAKRKTNYVVVLAREGQLGVLLKEAVRP